MPEDDSMVLAYFKERVTDVLETYCYPKCRGAAYVHLYGVSSLCALLARKRGKDARMCAVAGLLHDLYAYRAGSHILHAHSGAEMARVILKHSDYYTEEQRTAICTAIFHHSNKAHTHDAYSEVLKDADTLQPYLVEGANKAYTESPARLRRLACLSDELGIPLSTANESVLLQSPAPVKEPVANGPGEPARSLCREMSLPQSDGVMVELDGEAAGTEAERMQTPPNARRSSLIADNAARLAAQGIRGERDDTAYMELIRYWPERQAFDELKNGWCAAFVYHACMVSGLPLPIKYPGTSVRLAGVGGWYEWASQCGFYHEEGGAFAPERGDIVIYKGVIPPGKKPADAAWHDHIGIVVCVEGGSLTVAEGNVGNDNVSGVVRRQRGDRIGGYIRVPEDYAYDQYMDAY